MKVIEVKVYKFNELNEYAKQHAIEECRNGNVEDFWQSERINSFDKAKDIYNRIYKQDELTGVRLYKWIINNLSSEWINVNYIAKHEDGTFSNSEYKHKYNCVKKRLSILFVTNNLDNCPLTGVCYDYDFLKPIIDFLKYPTNISASALANYMPTYESIAERDFDYYNSEEAIIETIESNGYDFTEYGNIY